ncbi:MAG TPA: heme biosynthesis protein HemY, partial [Rhodobacteraceae bacterium]|nr:heme biosynthesis protein HemY [Paracoccaceae bacterium]
LTNVLAAQAAELTGDQRKAEEIYKQLIQEPSTRFVGIRGIMKQKLADGKTDIALKLAEKAFALKPKHVETQDTLLALQAQAKDWQGARHTLGAKLKHGALPRDVHKRRDAVLALSQAKDVLGQGQSIEAREAAIEANRLSPDLVPAAVMAARSYLDAEKPKYALRVIKKAWQAQPHPDLASIFAELAPEETPQQRLKRFSVLEKLAPAHRETRLALAELHLYAEDFPAAKRAVGTLLETEADARVLTIMAAIERGQGSPDKVIRGWLTKALAAQRGPRWVCDSCHGVNTVWSATCQHCEAFDTLSWRPAPIEDLSTSNGLDMVQLLMAEANPETAEGGKPNPEKALDVDTPAPESAAIELSEQAQEKPIN